MRTVTAVRPGLDPLVSGISGIVAREQTSRDTAYAVADLLRGGLPGLDVLTPEERAGSPDGYVSRVLHAQEDFSIVAVVWRPGQFTAIHDHVSWCTFGILSGVEYETLYRDMGDHLVEIGRAANRPGEVSGFAPPGDIHMVRNTSDEVGVSLHVYGADVSRLGSSVRRVYDLPVR
ncbi:cysteine dioxygenase [Nonomuraea sp. KC401]|uniref:cysteine dioxygenase family protein n=1 Tax=unclassified Nonomuraea TaxID=2593643 RepID=UPI0010FF192B|nr:MULTISPECIES: cysteine dioxygenase family protein [unclassified Nonomuraea]NBE96658.1 cysteine dioxygenase [Nonomuraea sp. K271]TLF67979.1 cysteine dioxygenase [Nonomuraea sp. KC401]